MCQNERHAEAILWSCQWWAIAGRELRCLTENPWSGWGTAGAASRRAVGRGVIVAARVGVRVGVSGSSERVGAAESEEEGKRLLLHFPRFAVAGGRVNQRQSRKGEGEQGEVTCQESTPHAPGTAAELCPRCDCTSSSMQLQASVVGAWVVCLPPVNGRRDAAVAAQQRASPAAAQYTVYVSCTAGAVIIIVTVSILNLSRRLAGVAI